MRLPATLSEEVVRTVVCSGCERPYGREQGTVLAASASGSGAGPIDALRSHLTALPLPREGLPDVPRSRLRAWAAVPLAVLGVIAGLSLIQGSSPTSPTAPQAAGGAEGATAAPVGARFIDQPGFSLALPKGWKRTKALSGAAFAAKAMDGGGDATLWIQSDPDLGFQQFERRSLAQLSELDPGARVVDRVDGPTLESTITELRADPPASGGGTSAYRVTLRASGESFLYLATSTPPGADPSTAAAVELIHGSIRPEVQDR